MSPSCKQNYIFQVKILKTCLHFKFFLINTFPIINPVPLDWVILRHSHTTNITFSFKKIFVQWQYSLRTCLIAQQIKSYLCEFIGNPSDIQGNTTKTKITDPPVTCINSKILLVITKSFLLITNANLLKIQKTHLKKFFLLNKNQSIQNKRPT